MPTFNHLSPVLGTEITGLNLNHLDDAMGQELRGLLAERGVLVIRNQQLDHEAHKNVAACFGTGSCTAIRWRWGREALIPMCCRSPRAQRLPTRLGMDGTRTSPAT